MQELNIGNPKPRVWQAVRSILFTLIACGAVFYLLYPSGLINTRLDIDLEFLMAPLWGYYALRLFSRLCSALLPSRRGLPLSYMFNGIAFSFFIYYLFDHTTLLMRISTLESYEWLLLKLNTINLYVILPIAGYTLSKLSTLLAESPKGWQAYPVGNAIGQLLIGYGVWQSLTAFSDSWTHISGIGLIVFAGMIAVAISNLGVYAQNIKNPFVADTARWLRQAQASKFCLGAAITAYIIFARPAIIDAFRYSTMIEWAIVCFIAWRLFTGVRSGLRTRYMLDIEEQEWRKHVQKIAHLPDRDLTHLSEILQRFVDYGQRDSLLVHLTLILDDNNLHQHEISQILAPIINHHDREIPWFAFGWEQRLILKQNQRNRQHLLDNVMHRLKNISQPAYQKIKDKGANL
ncbi:hypothetical protein ACFLTS_06595 [Chloroflexota bacterium]